MLHKLILLACVLVLAGCEAQVEFHNQQEAQKEQYKLDQQEYEALPELNMVPVAKKKFNGDDYLLFDLPDEGKRCIGAEVFRGGGVTCWQHPDTTPTKQLKDFLHRFGD